MDFFKNVQFKLTSLYIYNITTREKTQFVILQCLGFDKQENQL
jgi:hypothetical protein